MNLDILIEVCHYVKLEKLFDVFFSDLKASLAVVK